MKNTSKKNRIIEGKLKQSLILFGIIIFLLGLTPIILLKIYTEQTQEENLVEQYNADKMLQQDYFNMDVSEIDKVKGTSQIVTKDLQVITLTTNQYITEEKLTQKEWTNYLMQFGEAESAASQYNFSVAYDESKECWLVNAFPCGVELMLTVSYNPEGHDYIESVTQISIMFLLYVVIILGTVFMITHFTGKVFIHPLKELCSYAKVMEAGNYKERMQERLSGEFGELQQNFYELSDKLQQKTEENERIQSNRKEMLLDISHDLKNPLTTILGCSEVLLEKENSFEKQQQYLNAIYQNSVRANELLIGLFNYAKVESTSFVMKKEETDICEFMRIQVLKYVSEIELHEMQLACSIPDTEIWVEMDRELVERVIYNLIQNAEKYNKAGTNIFVGVKARNEEVEIEIADNGVGMKVELQDTIFEPFVRDDWSRNSKTGGSGLGLAVCKKIMNAHGGSITLRTHENEGCRFYLTFKKIELLNNFRYK